MNVSRQRAVQEAWFRTTEGEPAHLHTLSNHSGMRVSLTDWGATLVSIRLPEDGGGVRETEGVEVLLGFEDPADWEENPPYFGSTVGRYANRIAGGRFTLDGREVRLPRNLGPHHLHGGPRGFSHRAWSPGTVEEGPDRVSVTFRLRSPDGDQGYPGALDVAVTYTLDDGNRLGIRYEARTDRPTVVNLTNHAYFNLGGTRPARPVDDHVLRLEASRYTPCDPTGIPDGSLAPVTGTPLDFTRPRPLEGNGYDHNFAIDGWDGSLRRCARVTHPASGRSMEVHTTCPGVQLYTADGMAVEGGRAGQALGPRSGFCLETQFFPDSPNHPPFPGTRLDPGEVWRHETVYSFGT